MGGAIQRPVQDPGGIESVECSTGMEWWNGMVEWNGGMEWWNGMVEWTF